MIKHILSVHYPASDSTDQKAYDAVLARNAISHSRQFEDGSVNGNLSGWGDCLQAKWTLFSCP